MVTESSVPPVSSTPIVSPTLTIPPPPPTSEIESSTPVVVPSSATPALNVVTSASVTPELSTTEPVPTPTTSEQPVVETSSAVEAPTTTPTAQPSTSAVEPTTAVELSAPETSQEAPVQSTPITSVVPSPSSVQEPPVPSVSPSTAEIIPPESTSHVRPAPTPNTSDNWLPTTIVAETTNSKPPTKTTDGDSPKTTGDASQTSGLPSAINPVTTSVPGKDYDIVYIGFKSALNYPFVVQHSVSSAQIFEYLPGTIKFPFTSSDKYEDVAVKRLVPFTADGIDYTITVAELYFPKGSIDALRQFITTQDSKLYRNNDKTEHNLASLIDSRIPLTGIDLSRNSNSNGGSSNDYGSMDGDGSNAKISNKGKIAGITVGAAAGFGLYMSLMVLLFKKYKKKNSIELPYSDSESHVGSVDDLVFYNRVNDQASGNGSHSKSVQISDPVQASNSLGWS